VSRRDRLPHRNQLTHNDRWETDRFDWTTFSTIIDVVQYNLLIDRLSPVQVDKQIVRGAIALNRFFLHFCLQNDELRRVCSIGYMYIMKYFRQSIPLPPLNCKSSLDLNCCQNKLKQSVLPATTKLALAARWRYSTVFRGIFGLGGVNFGHIFPEM